jgi:hypothetical protein
MKKAAFVPATAKDGKAFALTEAKKLNVLQMWPVREEYLIF